MNQSPQILTIPLIGYSKSGKTVSMEHLIKYASELDYKVLALKHTGHKDFTIDTPGKNTWRYARAGASIIGSHSQAEDAIIIKADLAGEQYLRLIQHILQWPEIQITSTKTLIICEGFRDLELPHILCAASKKDLKQQIDSNTVVIAGAITSNQNEINEISQEFGLPCINITKHPETILKLFQNPNMS